MSKKTGFNATTITGDDYGTLHVSWLPEEPRRLMIGITGFNDTPHGAILSPEQAEEVRKTLLSKDHYNEDIEGSEYDLVICTTSRGEPYREGKDISLNLPETWDGGNIFLETMQVRDLERFLREG